MFDFHHLVYSFKRRWPVTYQSAPRKNKRMTKGGKGWGGGFIVEKTHK